ncbi:hypothetical protein FB451DRAFT_1271210 [Mycena latifolia]|nr:hypothetical protein FB451DRAFT_1271210 [Mycena latifolia]
MQFSMLPTSHDSSTFPIHEPPPEFLKLEKSIRALSTAVHEIQGQCEFRTRSSCESCETDKDRAKVFNHLATLLTMGSPLGRQTVAVTGGSSRRGFYINALEMIDQTSLLALREPAVKLNAILPSRKTLKQLAKDKRPISEITLTEHAGDIFQALRLLSHRRYSPERRSFDCFIINRCHLEINRRLEAAIGLLNPPLHDILSKWDLHTTDQIDEEWLALPYPPILIESFSIPYRRMPRRPDCLELLFNRENFGVWKTFFSSLLRVVVATLTGLRLEQSDSPTDAVLALHFLRLFLSFGPARVILNAPSLRSLLLEKLLPQHHLDFSDRHEKSPADVIFRGWSAVVAYDSAVSSLTSRYCSASAILRHALPTVHVITINIHAPSASTSKSMYSIPHIMRTKVMPALNLNKSYIALLETLISQHLSATEFPGAVHCEASMMGVAYAFGLGKSDPTLDTSTVFHNAFEAPSNTIGTTECPCQICAWLAEELLLPNGPFALPASHGKTVPWTPPRVGVSLAVLRSLELDLLELLTDTTQRWLEEKTRGAPELQFMRLVGL